MESTDVENIVYDHRLSTAVPASITGEDKVLNLTNADLAMKLHYIRGVYLFRSEAVDGLKPGDLKLPLFVILPYFYPAAGRIRKSPEDGRPFVKCNDSGVRIVEAKCSKTVDEWLDLNGHDHLLNHDQALGPDLGFSPLVFMQFTWFKCGGLSIGLSWAHVLGDAFSVSDFINKYGQAISGHHLPPKHPYYTPNTDNHNSPKPRDQKLLFPFSLGRVGPPVSDHWKITNTCKMATQSYHVTDEQLNELILKINSGLKESAKVKAFEAISALIWKSLAKVTDGLFETVTIVENNSRTRENEPSRNGQVISVVKAAEVKIGEANVLDLAKMITEKAVDEREIIDETMEEGENGNKSEDFFVYGANLTFMNLEDLEVYGFEIKGKKPIFANYSIGGVGDKGAVLVLPGPPENLKGKEGGRIVNVILPEHYLVGDQLKNKISKELDILGN